MSKYVDIEPLIQYAAEQAYCSFRYPTEIPPKELTEREVWEFVLKYLDFVSKEPVSDVAEVKHGRWKPHPTEREWDVCSVCGIGTKRREYGLQDGREWVTEWYYPYCPNCGAKMDE